MKFRTKKNQKKQEYDDYLSYGKAEDYQVTDHFEVQADDHPLSSIDENEMNYPDEFQAEPDDQDDQTEYEAPHEIRETEMDSPRHANEDFSFLVDEDYQLIETDRPEYLEAELPEAAYPSRQAYLQAQKELELEASGRQADTEADSEKDYGRRAKYSAKLDRFLTNGIIVVGVLLIVVLLIAFLV